MIAFPPAGLGVVIPPNPITAETLFRGHPDVVVAIDHTDSVVGAVRPFPSTLLNRSNDQLFTLGAELAEITISELRDGTFYAKLSFDSQEIDARPSDAIALALRFQAPIYVDDSVIQHSKLREGNVEVADTSEEGKKWADYLDKLSSEDFGKYKV